MTPWTADIQAPLSKECSRQKYWSELPFPPPGDLLDPGIEPMSPALHAGSLPLSPPGSLPSHCPSLLTPVGSRSLLTSCGSLGWWFDFSEQQPWCPQSLLFKKCSAHQRIPGLRSGGLVSSADSDCPEGQALDSRIHGSSPRRMLEGVSSQPFLLLQHFAEEPGNRARGWEPLTPDLPAAFQQVREDQQPLPTGRSPFGR